jgi:hypothetical protein
MSTWDTDLPPLLRALHALGFHFDELDFEPYDGFSPSDENAAWFRAWTGNPAADGADLRVFGQDGTGGYVAFWCVLPDAPIEDQPIVFLGSEGEKGVVAANLNDYLWLLAAGFGPFEAIELPHQPRAPIARFAAFAQAHASGPALTAAEVLARANAAWPGFAAHIDALCR